MSKKNPPPPIKTTPPTPASKQPPKQPEKKGFTPEDYVTLTIPLEEVKDIKLAFDIFDGDGSGTIDPQELKQSFIDLGFGGQNKFVYQILAELDEDQSGGIGFDEFLKLATAKLSEKDSRADIIKVFATFDTHKVGKITVL
jgi:centrin-1